MVNEVETKEQEAPVLITVAEAERLCSIPPRGGYQLIDKEWAPFVVRYGGTKRPAVRIIRARLLEWANGKRAA